MRYWYDTEFLEDGRTIELISIGIVAEDGREYYAVNAEVNASLNEGDLGKRISKNDWLMENVMPHLPLATKISQHSFPSNVKWLPPNLNMHDTRVKPRWVIANEVREFLTHASEDRDENELWAYYADYDHVLLCQLWGRMIGLPKGIPMWTHDLKQEMDRLGVTSEEFVRPIGEAEHNALSDARWNRDVFRHLKEREARA